MIEKQRASPRAGRYLMLAVLLTIISLTYWTAFSITSYNTYHEYSDLWIFSYDMYYHVNYPSVLHGLQFLAFGDHIIPDFLILLPIFAAAPSPLTLLFVQALAVSITGLVIFLVARELISDERTALLLSLAWFLNPGVIALLVFDFHAEAFVPLFAILTFYFFMKEKKAPFTISVLLLLGSIDVAALIAIPMSIAFAIYSIRTSDRSGIKKTKLIMSLSILVLALISLAANSAIYSNLNKAYASGAYASLPAVLRIVTVNSGAESALLNYHIMPFLLGPYALFALLIVIFSFGAAAVLDPVMLIILSSPWLFELFVLANTDLSNLFNQYFGIVLGGTMIASLMSIMEMKNSRKSAHNGPLERFRRSMGTHIDLSIGAAIVVFLLVYCAIIAKTHAENLGQRLLLQSPPNQSTYDAQLNQAISSIPQNASVMAPYFVASHLIGRRYIEIIPGRYQNLTLAPPNAIVISPNPVAPASIYAPSFIPQYVITDRAAYVNSNPVSGFAFASNLSADALYSAYGLNYSLYATYGTAMVLKSDG